MMPIRAILRIETALALAAAWGLVFWLPHGWMRRLFGPPAKAQATASEGLRRAEPVARRVSFVASRLPWHSSCLVQALAGALLLRRRAIKGAVIRFGVRKSGKIMQAHAWLILGETTLLGGGEAREFVPLADLTLDAGGDRAA